MLIPGQQLINTPVLGLHTGSELARTTSAVIDPRNLNIAAYQVDGPLLDAHPSFLRIADIRELSSIGMIIDSSDEFINIDDVIKLKTIYEYHFELIDMRVINQKGRKLGRVSDYTIDADTFTVHQLTVKRPLLKSLHDTELLIHRSNIVEINDTNIVVRTDTESPHVVTSNNRVYNNPFRQSPVHD